MSTPVNTTFLRTKSDFRVFIAQASLRDGISLLSKWPKISSQETTIIYSLLYLISKYRKTHTWKIYKILSWSSIPMQDGKAYKAIFKSYKWRVHSITHYKIQGILPRPCSVIKLYKRGNEAKYRTETLLYNDLKLYTVDLINYSAKIVKQFSALLMIKSCRRHRHTHTHIHVHA